MRTGTRIAILFILGCLADMPAFGQLDFKHPVAVDMEDESTPQEMVVGDFDNNGYRDIAYSKRARGGLTVMRNVGAGEFHSTMVSVHDGSFWLYPIASGDMDEDGIEDLIVFDNDTPSTNKVVLVRYDGADFNTSRHNVSPEFQQSNDIQVADFNGDGHLDIVCVSASGPVEVMEGDGAGNFAFRKLTSNTYRYSNISITDLNGDGKMDIVGIGDRSDNAGQVVKLMSDGNSYIEKRDTIRYPAHSIITPDFSGDNVPDVVISLDLVDSVVLLVNDGAGNLTANNIHQPADAQTFDGLAAGDFDSDGLTDIAISSATDKGVIVFRNMGTGSFQNVSTFRNQSDFVCDVTFDDLDGDGKQEIIALGGFKTIDVHAWDESSFIRTTSIFLGTTPTSGIVADLNADGYNDIISVSSMEGVVSLYYGEGSGQFANRRDYRMATKIGGVDIGHFNDDSFLDIVLSSQPGGGNVTGILLSNVDGSLSQTVTKIASLSGYHIKCADVNGDGKTDVIIGNRVLVNNGVSFVARGYLSGLDAHYLEIGDLDGDGDLDLVVQNFGRTLLKFSLNDGSGNYSNFQSLDNSESIFFFELADLDNDNAMEIILSYLSESKITIAKWQQDGFHYEHIATDSPSRFTMVADYDMDGRLDIASQLGGRDFPYALLLQEQLGEFVRQDQSFAHVPPQASMQGDVNSDGRPDIIHFGYDFPTIAVQINDLVVEPSTSPELEVTSVKSTSASLAVKPGDGHGRIILIKEGDMVNGQPKDSTFYSGDLAFGGGAEIGMSNYVLSQGNHEVVTITSLNENTTYHVSVFEYNSNQRNSIINYRSDPMALSFRTKKIQEIQPVEDITLTTGLPEPISVVSSSSLPVSLEVIQGDVQVSGNIISVLGPGPVKLQATQSGDDEYDELVKLLEFCVNPPVPSVTVEEHSDPFSITLTSTNPTPNQWIANGNDITGETEQIFKPTVNGVFQVKVDYDGCFSISEPSGYLYTGIDQLGERPLAIYPNPVDGVLFVKGFPFVVGVTISDPSGRVVYKSSTFSPTFEIDMSRLPPAVYILKVETIEGTVMRRIVR